LHDTLTLLSQYQTQQQRRHTDIRSPDHDLPTIPNEQITLLLSRRSPHQAKVDSLEEWTQLPLSSPTQRIEWLEKKTSEFKPLTSDESLPQDQGRRLITGSNTFEESGQTSPASWRAREENQHAGRKSTPINPGSTSPASLSPVHHFHAASRQNSLSESQASASPNISNAQRLSTTQWRRFF